MKRVIITYFNDSKRVRVIDTYSVWAKVSKVFVLQLVMLFSFILTIGAAPVPGKAGSTPEVDKISPDSPIRLDFRLASAVTSARTISLTSLGIDANGRGARMFDLIIENVTNQPVSGLYLDITVRSSKYGVIAEVITPNHQPFTLQPFQLVIGNNNTLQGGLPGVTNTGYEGGLTAAGEDLINDLTGSPRVPDDVYSVTVSIYKGANRQNGGQLLASITESYGGQPIENVVDFFLIQPGGPVGSGDRLMNRTPVFRWEGPNDIRYRIIVVEDNGQTPQTLIQGALSTEPTRGPGSQGSSMLDYEMIDAYVNGTSFQYPPAGAKPLREGRRYYWQIFAELPSVGNVVVRPSAIMEFSIPSSRTTSDRAQAQEETVAAVATMSPRVAAQIAELIKDGFGVSSVIIDGQEVSGAALIAYLDRFMQRVQNGEIIIVND